MALKISPSKIVEYRQSNKTYNKISAMNLRQVTGDRKNDISRRTKSRLRDTITTWIDSLKRSRQQRLGKSGGFAPTFAKPNVVCNLPTFYTLTFPNNGYNEKYVLKKWLQYICRHGTTNYFWKAEQHLNGQIHFHIIADNLNFEYLTKWQQLTGSNENHVEEIKGTKRIVDYILKDTEIEIGGKLWGKSKGLKRYEPTTLDNHQGRMFLLDWSDDLSLQKEADYYKIYRPSNKLSSEILDTYLI